MKLVEKDAFAKASNLEKVGLKGLAGIMMKILKIDNINEVYEKLAGHKGVEFIDKLFEELHVTFEYFEEELGRIPKSGPFITVSNHPLGGVDGVILIKLISLVRPDFKIIANFLLKKIEPISDFIMPVNPFESDLVSKSSVPGIKDAIQHLKQGHPLGMFPAGEVSTYHFEEGKILDKEWEPGAIKLISKMKVPVVPVYFKARNSFWFYLLASMHPLLRTAKLPSEIFSQKKKPITVRIGKPIQPAELDEYPDIESLSQFLRTRTYMLASTLPPKKAMLKLPVLQLKKDIKPIAEPAPLSKVIEEIEQLRSKGKKLTSTKNYEVYEFIGDVCPYLLHEIGRLREVTFREVGEGSNAEIDLDEFDQYYTHLILWDSEARKLAGAYRLGIGAQIYPKFGLKGFYVPTLFKIEPEAEHLFSQGIEMGRAFVVKEYQAKPLPLFLLWKGIVHIILRNPGHRYLTGCVSISNSYSKFSRALMIEFIKLNYLDKKLAKYIKPRKAYKVKIDEREKEFVLSRAKNDLSKLDKFIEDLEPGNTRVPVLLKKYIKQNAKVVAFNVDPKFNNTLDAFMYIDINDLPTQTIQPVLEELEAATRIAQNAPESGE
ncbi:lysophospholipid acyltransferase family protein [Schleiferia thermophila]|jgi:putative hemolysin|uniref:lysophospholipid acyltransferase family protein n=1 Tax=Schleiferia thermophila TaxID=884107 RepID=UPI0004E6B257|nr:lysophospholipid acyltransferase family protein [Schleiferia thermophila]KFD39140.1 glycerol acyltransferase [Schleiferia thermophila str. Yellowstone]PMB31593.1 glycerol acyltransferase [Fischerella thermalis CCMEE 5319]